MAELEQKRVKSITIHKGCDYIHLKQGKDLIVIHNSKLDEFINLLKQSK